MSAAAMEGLGRRPQPADRQVLSTLERISRTSLAERRPEWPGEHEPAVLYLAHAIAMRASSMVAPEAIVTRLRELGWLRGAAPRQDLAAGVAWLDWGRAKRTGVLAASADEAFAAIVLRHQLLR